MSSSSPETRSSRWRADIAFAVLAGAIALAARILVAVAAPESAPVSDMQDYWERAVHIFTTGTLYANSWRMPGYPLLLALAFGPAGGPSLAAARALNVAAGVATTLLTYALARRAGGRRTALAAALAVALYPSLLLYTTFVATENLVTVPLLGALLAGSYRTPRAAVLAGLCTGLAILIRPASIALVPAVLFTLALRGEPDRAWRPGLLRAGVAGLLCVAILVPWWVHSARLYGRFVPLDTTGGLNLLIGTGPDADGRWHWRHVSALLAGPLSGVDVTTPEGAATASAIAMDHVRAQPLASVRILPRKLSGLLAVEGREQAMLYGTGYFGPRSSAVVRWWGLAVMAGFPLLWAAALAGMAVRRGLPPWLLASCGGFVVASVAMHLVAFGDPRFHMPLVPVLAVLASGLAGWRSGFVPWRAAAAVIVLCLLAGPWIAQVRTYHAALEHLAGPQGWESQVAFDDLL